MLKRFHSCFVMGLALAARPSVETEVAENRPDREASPGGGLLSPPALEPAPELDISEESSKVGGDTIPLPDDNRRTNRSSAAFGPIRGREAGPEAVAGWRRELKKRLDLAERRVMSQWGPEAALSARRMVTVWLDELLLTAPWPGRRRWLGQPLQKDWAEGRSGGQWFFEELDNLTPDRRDNRELAALALRCLTLGLAGRYGRSPEQLQQVRRQTLDRFGFLADSPVFPPPMPRRPAKKVWLGPLARRLMLGLGLGLLLFWLAGDLALNRRLVRIHEQTSVLDYEPEPVSVGSLHGRLWSGEELK